MRSLLGLALGAVLLASCSQPAPDVTTVRQEIRAMMDKAEKDMMSGTFDTTFMNYTDDAISMPNNSPMLKGKAAFREYSALMASAGMKFTDVKFTTEDIMVGTPYIIEVGTYVMTVHMAGGPGMTDKGKYLNVYQRMADGSLKARVETWNTDTPTPTGEPQAGATAP